MKLWEALKIHEETGALIKPRGFTLDNFKLPHIWMERGYVSDEWEVEPPKPKVITISETEFVDRWDREMPNYHLLKTPHSTARDVFKFLFGKEYKP